MPATSRLPSIIGEDSDARWLARLAPTARYNARSILEPVIPVRTPILPAHKFKNASSSYWCWRYHWGLHMATPNCNAADIYSLTMCWIIGYGKELNIDKLNTMAINRRRIRDGSVLKCQYSLCLGTFFPTLKEVSYRWIDSIINLSIFDMTCRRRLVYYAMCHLILIEIISVEYLPW